MEKKLKKLSLKKETITSLSSNEQRHIYGGDTTQNDGNYDETVIAPGCEGGGTGSCNNCGGSATCGGTCGGTITGTTNGVTCGDTNGNTCGSDCGMTGGNTCGNCGGGDDSVIECYTVNVCYSMPPHCTMTYCSVLC